jgi:type V secretory pathway adhesin AidA
MTSSTKLSRTGEICLLAPKNTKRTWGEVSANWVGNKNMDGTPVAIQGKTLISGSLVLQGSNIKLNGTKVLGTKVTGYGDFTNGSKTGFDATTATLPQVAAVLAQVITDIKHHMDF